MKITSDNILKMSNEEIYSFLLSYLASTYKSFNYLLLTSDELKTIVFEELNIIKREPVVRDDFLEYLKKRLKARLSSLTIKRLNDSHLAFSLINNYIIYNLDDASNYQDVLAELRKYSAFLGKYDFYPNPDLLIQLLEDNSLLNNLLKIFYQENIDVIKKGDIDKVTGDNLLLSLIKCYCMLNNIEINTKDKIEISDEKSVATDSIRQYLKEIGQFPLLTPTEEKELVIKAHSGNKDARDTFINCNLRLVASIAKRYIGRGVPYLDLIEEGNIGLMTALDHFDPNRNIRFSTYASNWISQGITRYIGNMGRNIRIPIHLYERVGLYIRISNEFEKKYNREATIEEKAAIMHLSLNDIKTLDKLQSDTISLNEAINDNHDTEIGDLIANNDESFDDLLAKKELISVISKLIKKSNLNDREKDVLLKRTGFQGSHSTLEEIGDKYHITRERVRQIQNKALMKLVFDENAKPLAFYMDDPDRAIKYLEKIKEEYISKGKSLKSIIPNPKKGVKSLSKGTTTKPQSLYNVFPYYSKEDIIAMLNQLNPDEKAIIFLRYGEDLMHPQYSNLSKAEAARFYRSIFPKMKGILISKNSTVSLEDVNENILVGDKPKEEVKEISSDDYQMILDLLNTKTWKEITKILTMKEAIVLILKLGYINNKCFADEAIARILKTSKEDTQSIYLKALKIFKKYMSEVNNDKSNNNHSKFKENTSKN
jgi:RNA polymerase primary sigma factor